MDKRSDAITERTNAISANKESSFPHEGIFGPHGFLSTIPSSTSEDPGDDSSAKCDGQKEDQDKVQLPPTKKLKSHATGKSGTIVMQNNDIPPSQAAFDIDHVLENVIHSLETSDLLTCRLVCHRWCIVATPELQKTLKIAFLGDRLRTSRPEFELRKFTRLLRHMSEKARSRFPCRKFKFQIVYDGNGRESGRIRSTQLQNFLDIYGIHIHSLSINYHSVPILEKVAVAELRILLVEQTPNLEHLSLTVGSSEGVNSGWMVKSKNFGAYKNKCLKTVWANTESRVSFEVLEGVLDLAPNLVEFVHYDGDLGVSKGFGGNYKYSLFRNPLNRLHLLKEAHLGHTLQEIESLEKIAWASLHHPGTLKLRQFTMDSFNWWGRPQETLRFVTIMNRLLACSSDTLETIKWKNATFLKGMEWGKVMSKLKALRLHINVGNYGGRIFPPGFGLSATFPKLRSFEILYNCDESDFLEFLNSLKPEEVLNSVKSVRIQDSSHDHAASTEVSELLRKLFPKAEIQYPVQDLKSFN